MTDQRQGSYALYLAAATHDEWIVLDVPRKEIMYQGPEPIAEAVFQRLVISEQLLPGQSSLSLRAGLEAARIGAKNAEGEGRSSG